MTACEKDDRIVKLDEHSKDGNHYYFHIERLSHIIYSVNNEYHFLCSRLLFFLNFKYSEKNFLILHV